MGFPVSQGEREQTARARTPPGASSSLRRCLPGMAARASSSSETLQNLEGKRPSQLVGVCRGRGALRLPPQAPHVLGQPSVPFHVNGGCREPAGRLLEAHVFSQPPLLDLGGQSLLPPVTQRQMLAHRAAQKERALWGGGEVCF